MHMKLPNFSGTMRPHQFNSRVDLPERAYNKGKGKEGQRQRRAKAKKGKGKEGQRQRRAKAKKGKGKEGQRQRKATERYDVQRKS
jgi:hypothetical protein